MNNITRGQYHRKQEIVRNQSLSDPSDVVKERAKSTILNYLITYRNSLSPKVTLKDIADILGLKHASLIKLFESRHGESGMAIAIKYAAALGLEIVAELENKSMPPVTLYEPTEPNDVDPCILIIRQGAMNGRRRPLTLLELSQAVEMSHVGFMRVMNGKNKGMMKINLFEKLCKICGVKISIVKSGRMLDAPAVKGQIARKRISSKDNGYIPAGFKSGDEILLSFETPKELHDFISQNLPIMVKGLRKGTFTSTKARHAVEDHITKKLLSEAMIQKRMRISNHFPD